MKAAAIQISREEGVGASVVARLNTPPVLESAEHVFDLVELFVEHLGT